MLGSSLLSFIDIWMLLLKIKGYPLRNNYSFSTTKILSSQNLSRSLKKQPHTDFRPSRVIDSHEDGLSLGTMAAESGRWLTRQAKQWGVFRWCGCEGAVQVRKDWLLRGTETCLSTTIMCWPHCTPLQLDWCPVQPKTSLKQIRV